MLFPITLNGSPLLETTSAATSTQLAPNIDVGSQTPNTEDSLEFFLDGNLTVTDAPFARTPCLLTARQPCVRVSSNMPKESTSGSSLNIQSSNNDIVTTGVKTQVVFVSMNQTEFTSSIASSPNELSWGIRLIGVLGAVVVMVVVVVSLALTYKWWTNKKILLALETKLYYGGMQVN